MFGHNLFPASGTPERSRVDRVVSVVTVVSCGTAIMMTRPRIECVSLSFTLQVESLAPPHVVS